jgi:enoyl-[acyl-carrier protein] reductase I
VRYLAADLGPKGIRVNALSPGPLKTRASSGIADFDQLIDQARARAPEHRLVSIDDVGAIATGLVSDFARNVTGNIAYVDAGYHVMS